MASSLFKTLLASAARTTTQTLAGIATGGRLNCHVILDQTVNAGSLGSITLTIQGYDKAGGAWYDILAGAAVAAVAKNVYKVGPGLPATANVSANDALPGLIRVLITANNANPTTYSCGIWLM